MAWRCILAILAGFGITAARAQSPGEIFIAPVTRRRRHRDPNAGKPLPPGSVPGRRKIGRHRPWLAPTRIRPTAHDADPLRVRSRALVHWPGLCRGGVPASRIRRDRWRLGRGEWPVLARRLRPFRAGNRPLISPPLWRPPPACRVCGRMARPSSVSPPAAGAPSRMTASRIQKSPLRQHGRRPRRP